MRRPKTRKVLNDIWSKTPETKYRFGSVGEKLVASILVIAVALTIREWLARLGQKRVLATEMYHAVEFSVLVLVSACAIDLPIIGVWLIAAYAVFEIVSWSLFDVFIEARIEKLHGRRTSMRAFIWAVYGYTIVIWCYGLVFLVSSDISNDGHPLSNFWEAIYFSITTITTLGYGDFAPSGNSQLMQLITVSEPLLGFVLALIYLPALITSIGADFRQSLKDE